MPFDLEQTTHVFQKLEDGGLQKVRVKDPLNKKQIALIQAQGTYALMRSPISYI